LWALFGISLLFVIVGAVRSSRKEKTADDAADNFLIDPTIQELIVQEAEISRDDAEENLLLDVSALKKIAPKDYSEIFQKAQTKIHYPKDSNDVKEGYSHIAYIAGKGYRPAQLFLLTVSVELTETIKRKQVSYG
jgi:hypothetical protein